MKTQFCILERKLAIKVATLGSIIWLHQLLKKVAGLNSCRAKDTLKPSKRGSTALQQKQNMKKKKKAITKDALI